MTEEEVSLQQAKALNVVKGKRGNPTPLSLRAEGVAISGRPNSKS
ncbi:unnamed protein product [marine sediment metagenome]|uniref:Uncharacterized protein n=1 Tax=marine sediment metagenome TaxID=412755 RepID=X1MZJ7_9ZZZZ